MQDITVPENELRFDNRKRLGKLGLSVVQHGLDRITNKGGSHFVLDLPDLRLGYCYIRKNACTSFKNMFMDIAPKGAVRHQNQRPIDFLQKNMRLRRKHIRTCDRLIFVYREPVERIVSLYKNKFIMRSGNKDIFKTYEKLTGTPPEEASFQSFVRDYFKNDFSVLDRHVLPQRRHLYHAVYTDAVPMERLHPCMRNIIGGELADKYFLHKSNASHIAAPTTNSNDVSGISSEELFEAYSKNDILPDNVQLLTEELEAWLKNVFREDIELIEFIERRQLDAHSVV